MGAHSQIQILRCGTASRREAHAVCKPHARAAHGHVGIDNTRMNQRQRWGDGPISRDASQARAAFCSAHELAPALLAVALSRTLAARRGNDASECAIVSAL